MSIRNGIVRRRRLIQTLVVASLFVTGAWLFSHLVFRIEQQAVTSPDGKVVARLFWLAEETGPAPYGNEVTVGPTGRIRGWLSGDSAWVGYCPKGRLEWLSASLLELTCQPGAESRDVTLLTRVGDVEFRVTRPADGGIDARHGR